MGKRAANPAAAKGNPAAAKGAVKKPKVDPALASVVGAIKSAGHLPERCCTLLMDLLPFSLPVAADVRSESQTVVVDMIEETLMAVKSSLEAEVTAQKEKEQSIETTMTDLTRAVDEANVEVEKQKDVCEAAKSSLDDATKAMNDSQQALVEKQNIQKSGDEKVKITRDTMISLETAFKEHWQTPAENSQAPIYSGLEPFLHQLDIEHSLLTALPGTCAKDQASRGEFDDVVLTEFEKAMTSKIASLKETLETEVAASAEREEQVKRAEEELTSKKEEREHAEDALVAARKELGEREVSLMKAKDAVNDLQHHLAIARRLNEDAHAKVKDFVANPLAEFLTLKSKVTTSVEAVHAAPAGA